MIEADPGVVYLVDKPGAVQSVLSVGRRWYGRNDPRYFASLVGNRILGGDFLSRLNQNLREKNGFTYGAGSYFDFRRNGSVWAVQTAVRADATAPALREVFRELDALAGDRPFTEEEIGTAVGAEVRSFPDSFESPSSHRRHPRRPRPLRPAAGVPGDLPGKLQQTTPDAVLKAMTAVVEPKERVVLVVGDRAASSRSSRSWDSMRSAS